MMRVAILGVLVHTCLGPPASSLLAAASAGPDAGTTGAPGASRVAEERAVEQIRALYKQVNGSVPRTPSAVLCMNEAGEWTSVLGKAPPEGCAPVADVYRVGDAIRKVVTFEDSEAGDWTSRAEHYFYPEGRVAFRFEHLKSFQGHDPQSPEGPSGPFVVETRTYFDQAGKQVRQLKKAVFEPTGKEVPASVVAQPETTRLVSSGALKTAK